MKKNTSLVLASTIVLASGANAATNAISWNLDRWGTVSGTNEAGVVLVSNWNNSWPSNPTTNLIDNTNTPTTLDISYTSNDQWNIQGSTPAQDADGSYNKRLLNGYLNAGSSVATKMATINLAEIPYATYDIYVYFGADQVDRAGSVTVGSTTYYYDTVGSASISSGNALLVQTTETTDVADNINANYARFTDLTGSSQTITTNIPNFGGIAGFQVVQVPEPSAALIGGLGMLCLLRRRRA